MGRRLNISMDVVRDLTIKVRRENELLGTCPVCQCNDANFNIKKMVWRCWHCPNSGTIDGGSGYYFGEIETPKYDIPKIRSLYAKLADKYHKNLNSKIVDYLNERGLTDKTIEKFKLGFCSGGEWLDEYADVVAKDAGIIIEDYPVLSNRLVIPYMVDDVITDLRGRALNTIYNYKQDTPTYISLVGSYEARGAVYFFNHTVIEDSDTVIITEGEFKALVAMQHNFPIVATPGITWWNNVWNRVLKDKKIILAADTEDVIGRRSPCYIQAKILRTKLPHLKVAIWNRQGQEKIDVDWLILNRGVQCFVDSIEGAISVDKYLKQEERKPYGRRSWK